MSLAIRCKGCDKEIPADDVNIDTRLAKCRACNAIFEISDQVHARARVARGPVPMPKNMVVAEGPDSLTVVRKWGRGPAIFLLVFATFWNLIVSVFVVAAASGAEFKNEGGGVVSRGFIWLFLTPFILVGASVAYVALAFLLNKTTISLEGKLLSVTHKPIRWMGRRQLKVSEISQLFCTEYVAYRQNNVPQNRMCLNALMTDGARIELVKGLEDAGQAFNLEDLFERRLRIEQRPISGEYRGGHLG